MAAAMQQGRCKRVRQLDALRVRFRSVLQSTKVEVAAFERAPEAEIERHVRVVHVHAEIHILAGAVGNLRSTVQQRTWPWRSDVASAVSAAVSAATVSVTCPCLYGRGTSFQNGLEKTVFS